MRGKKRENRQTFDQASVCKTHLIAYVRFPPGGQHEHRVSFELTASQAACEERLLKGSGLQDLRRLI